MADPGFLALLALLLLRGQGSKPSATTPGPSGLAREVPIVRTGEADLVEWATRRLALTLAVLGALEPPVRGSRKADDVALALLAQWAHETDAGRAEYNFNLGGWTARKRDTFHTAPDRLSSAAGFRWTAYPDLPTAVEDQINRLIRTFPSAWGKLLQDPVGDGWVRELGRRGYYTAEINDYARAWAARRAQLVKALRIQTAVEK
jgi:hypothetical protein